MRKWKHTHRDCEDGCEVAIYTEKIQSSCVTFTELEKFLQFSKNFNEFAAASKNQLYKNDCNF